MAADPWATPPTPEEIAAKDSNSGLSLNDLVLGRTAPHVSKTESAARGVVQGASLGFGDELAGLAGAIGVPPGVLRVAMAANPAIGVGVAQLYGLKKLVTEGPGKMLDDYRATRDAERNANAAAQSENPWTYGTGQFAGGLATAAIPGVGAAKTAAQAVLGGAALAGVGGLGESRADLTKGEVERAATDAAVGAGAGLAGGALGYGAGKVLGAAAGVVRKLASPAKAAARETAQTAADLSAAGYQQTKSSFYKQSMQLQDEVSKTLGEDFRLRPSQSTGDRAAALAESKVSQWPATMNPAQAAEHRQLQQTGRWLDSMVDGVSAKPELLGKSDVSGQVASALDRHMQALVKARSEAVGPLYKAAEEAAGGARVIPTDKTREAMDAIIEANKFAPAKITGAVKSSLQKIEGGVGMHGQQIPGAASATGRLSITDMQNLRSLWGQAARGDVTIIEGLSEANQRRLARQVLAGIDADLEEAGKGIASKKAAGLLQEANTLWREHSQAIDEAGTETVRRLLKVGETDAADTITTKLLQSSPDQIRGVFRILGKSAPDVAQQTRAQLLEDLFVQAGKPQRGGSIAAELGVTELQPGNALRLLKNAEPRLLAAFEGDAKATAALRKSMQLLQRLSFGPGIKGSQTAPLIAQAADESAKMAVASAAGPAGTATVSLVSRFLGSGKRLATALSTPEGIDVFNEAMQAQLAAGRGKTPSAATVASIAARTEALGLIDGGDEPPPTGRLAHAGEQR